MVRCQDKKRAQNNSAHELAGFIRNIVVMSRHHMYLSQFSVLQSATSILVILRREQTPLSHSSPCVFLLLLLSQFFPTDQRFDPSPQLHLAPSTPRPRCSGTAQPLLFPGAAVQPWPLLLSLSSLSSSPQQAHNGLAPPPLPFQGEAVAPVPSLSSPLRQAPELCRHSVQPGG